MQSLVRDLNLTDRVTFTGYRTDVPEVLKALDVTVQASLSENLGGTIEGTLMETPMVATRVGGLIDSVVDGETGILVAADDPASLAKGISDCSSRSRRSPATGEARPAIHARAFHVAQNSGKRARALSEAAATVAARLPTASNVWKAVLGGRISGYLAARYRFIDAWLLPLLGFRFASLAFR